MQNNAWPAFPPFTPFTRTNFLAAKGDCFFCRHDMYASIGVAISESEWDFRCPISTTAHCGSPSAWRRKFHFKSQAVCHSVSSATFDQECCSVFFAGGSHHARRRQLVERRAVRANRIFPGLLHRVHGRLAVFPMLGGVSRKPVIYR